MKKVTFIKGDLPVPTSRLSNGVLWDELTERPGEWAKFWGGASSAYTAAKHAAFSRPDYTFESRVIAGEAYVRAVKK